MSNKPFKPSLLKVTLTITLLFARQAGAVGGTRAEADCVAGKTSACFAAAFEYENGRNDKVSCDGGVLGGPKCFDGKVQFPPSGTVARDVGRAIALYERACVAGVSQGCVNAGYLLDVGQTARDPQRIRGLYERACELSQPAGCHNLALMYEAGDAVARDITRARTLFQKACDGGVGAASGGLKRLSGATTGHSGPTKPAMAR